METSRPTYYQPTEAQRSFTTPQDFYLLRDFGQKFEATVAFTRQHWRNMYRVLLVPVLLAVLPMVAFSLFQVLNLTGQLGESGRITSPSAAKAMLLTMGPALVVVALMAMVTYSVLYAMFYSFVKARMYHPDPAAAITPREVWEAARPYVLPLIGYFVVAGLLTGIAMVFLILPGLYVGVVFQLLMPVVIFEEGDLGQRIGRCFSLISGKWWSTFGLLFVGAMAIGMITIPFSLISQGAMVAVIAGGGTISKTVLALAQLLQTLVQMLLSPILTLLLLFQYFNLVERRDHVSLQWRAEQLGQTPGPAHPTQGFDDSLFRPSYGDQSL